MTLKFKVHNTPLTISRGSPVRLYTRAFPSQFQAENYANYVKDHHVRIISVYEIGGTWHVDYRKISPVSYNDTEVVP